MKKATLKCGNEIERLSRWLKVHENSKGWYFNFRGRKYYLDNIEDVPDPIMYSWEDEDGKLQFVSGYMGMTYFCAWFIEVHPDGEYVRVWADV